MVAKAERLGWFGHVRKHVAQNMDWWGAGLYRLPILVGYFAFEVLVTLACARPPPEPSEEPLTYQVPLFACTLIVLGLSFKILPCTAKSSTSRTIDDNYMACVALWLMIANGLFVFTMSDMVRQFKIFGSNSCTGSVSDASSCLGLPRPKSFYFSDGFVDLEHRYDFGDGFPALAPVYNNSDNAHFSNSTIAFWSMAPDWDCQSKPCPSIKADICEPGMMGQGGLCGTWHTKKCLTRSEAAVKQWSGKYADLGASIIANSYLDTLCIPAVVLEDPAKWVPDHSIAIWTVGLSMIFLYLLYDTIMTVRYYYLEGYLDFSDFWETSRQVVPEAFNALQAARLTGKGFVPPTSEEGKKKMVASYKAVDDYIQSGMIIGVGTGSTVYYAVARIGSRFRRGELTNIAVIAASVATAEQAAFYGIPLVTLDTHPEVDIAIAGAQEVDPYLNIVKGGNKGNCAAFSREKMIATYAKKFIVVVDESKVHDGIGIGCSVPVEVSPYCPEHTMRQIAKLPALAGCQPVLRKESFGVVGDVLHKIDNELVITGGSATDRPVITDNGNFIVDVHFLRPVEKPASAAAQLKGLVGVVEHGLFTGIVSACIVGKPDSIAVMRPAMASGGVQAHGLALVRPF
jgi:ribose 5-phosphate isomerase A